MEANPCKKMLCHSPWSLMNPGVAIMESACAIGENNLDLMGKNSVTQCTSFGVLRFWTHFVVEPRPDQLKQPQITTLHLLSYPDAPVSLAWKKGNSGLIRPHSFSSHCSRLQSSCSLANWNLFSLISFTVFLWLSSCLVPIPWVLLGVCMWKWSYFNFLT